MWTMPTAFGEKLVMRIFNPDVLVKDFSELGFADEDLKKWNGMIAKPHGIVMVTGPTGSGKTTTLYRYIKELGQAGLILHDKATTLVTLTDSGREADAN